MPEGDTLHKIASAMAPLAEGRPVEALWLRGRGFVDVAPGLGVEEVAALGKHLLVSLAAPGPPSARWVLHVHLGMYGRVATGEPGRAPGAETTLQLALPERAWRFRRTATAELLRGVELAQHPVLSRLGPDLLDRRLDLDAVVARARRAEPRSVSALLLDQRVASGIGNVYRNEVLFIEGLDPQTPVAGLSDAWLRRLYARSRQLMRQNLGGWPRTTVRRVDATRPLQRGEPRHFVHRRAGLPCLRCATPIRAGRHGDAARASFWCPRCQARSVPRPAA